MVKLWKWLVENYKEVFGILAFCGAAAMGWFSFLEARHKYTERKLSEDKKRILVILRSEMAFPGLNGKTIEQIVSNSNPKFSKKRVEIVLRSLANENPPRVHCLYARFYLGPVPPEIAIMLLKLPSSEY
ncbi:MAG: hypothetical protein WA857_21590 [Candidatus Acidiferrum sp.]